MSDIIVTLDHGALSAAVTNAVSPGIDAAVAHYSIRADIQKATEKAMSDAGLVQMVTRQINDHIGTHAEALAAQVVAGCGPAIVEALRVTFTGCVADVVVAAKTRGAYVTEAQRLELRAQALREIRGEPVRTEVE